MAFNCRSRRYLVSEGLRGGAKNARPEGLRPAADRSGSENLTGPCRPTVLVIVGPTGVGKTEVACLVARAVGGEIVSADSRQIYRGMNIGTDKPDALTREKVPHHMVDVVDPAEPFDAARFCSMARDCFVEISSRSKIPILVGGSGLYVKAALYGMFPGPSRDEPLRDRLLAEENKRPGSLHERLTRVDPARAARVAPSDQQRIVRAIEFHELTGGQMSRAEAAWSPQEWPHTAFALVRPRRELYRRIDARVEEMFRRGLLKEVEALLGSGLAPGSPGMRSIGYREAVAHLAGEITEDQARARIQLNSRRYAKRQMTWFKRMSVSQWISVDDAAEAASEITRMWGDLSR